MKPSRELLDTVYSMERIQTWMREDQIADDFDEPTIVGSLKGKESVKDAAKIIRDDLELKPDWFQQERHADALFPFLRRRVSKAGVLVMISGIVGTDTKRVLNLKEFRAFALIDSCAPLIFN